MRSANMRPSSEPSLCAVACSRGLILFGSLILGWFSPGCSDPGGGEPVAVVATGPPQPFVVLNVNVSCIDCPAAATLRPSWFAALAARCNPDVVMVQGLSQLSEVEAFSSALPGLEPFYVGKTEMTPPYFQSVTWLEREAFKLVGNVQRVSLGPDSSISSQSRLLILTVLQDCRSDLIYNWIHALLPDDPAFKETALQVIGEVVRSNTIDPHVLGGGWGISVADALYPELLALPRANRQFQNTSDLADVRETPASLDTRTLTDHLLVPANPPWHVSRWSVSTTDFQGQRMTDHPPICGEIQQQGVTIAEATIAQSKSCRIQADAGAN
jgi:hypothetical protein